MARMFPPLIENFNYDHISELEIYSLLEDILPESYYVFGNIRIDDSKPDFVIIGPDIGLIVLEVKSWSLNFISNSNVNSFSLKNGKTDTNPYEQANKNANTTVNYLEREQLLCQSNERYKGNLKFCYAYGVIFTNINRDEFMNSYFKESIDPKYIIFKDDIEEIRHKRDTFKLEIQLRNMFVPKNSFKFDHLSKEDMILIEQTLYKSSNFSSQEKSILNDKYSNIQKESKINHPPKENILGKTNLSSKSPSSTKFNKSLKTYKPKYKKGFIHSLKNMILGIIKAISIIFTFNLCIVLIATIMGLYIRGDLRNIMDVPVLVQGFIQTFSSNKENKVTGDHSTMKSSLTFNVNNNPQGEGTFILIKDGSKYLTSKTFLEGSIIEFYDNKKVIIYEAKSDEIEFYIENDIVDLEVGNAYTKIYLNGEEVNNLKYFKYDFANRGIVKIK